MNSRNLSTDYGSLILLPVITDESDFVASFPNIYIDDVLIRGGFQRGYFITIHVRYIYTLAIIYTIHRNMG